MGVSYKTPEEILRDKSELEIRHHKPSPWTNSKNGIVVKWTLGHSDKKEKILDVGTGEGRLLNSLKENGFNNLFGVDIDNYLLESSSIEFHKVDVSNEKLPYPDAFFEKITCLGILEHVENPFNMMREVTRVLKEEGILFVTSPNIHSYLDKFLFLFTGNLFLYGEQNNHIFIATPAILKKSLLRDYELLETFYSNPLLPIVRPRRVTKWIQKWLPAIKFLSVNVCWVLKKK